MLLILDMVNHEVNFTPIFRYPSTKGIISGVISFTVYLLLMFVLSFISKIKTKKEIKRFIFINLTAFILGLLLFWMIGATFFISTPNYA